MNQWTDEQMKQLSASFTYIFSDNEWFNKVLIGGFYFVMIPFGIGIIMLNGFLAEFLAGVKNGERSMPYWRNSKAIFRAGFLRSSLSLGMLVVCYCSLFFLSIPVTIPGAILLLTSAITLNALMITGSAGFLQLVVSLGLLVTAISIGWMWIVVGWPLLIFLAMLVQVYMLGVKGN